MGSVSTTYTRRPAAAVETEAQALAAVYRFILDCHAKKKADAGPTGDDDTKEIKNGS